MTDDEFLKAFEDCRIPRDRWTHEAHVRMAWIYLRRWPLERVIPIVREGIRRYNASLGNEAGYHETITVGSLVLIDRAVALGGADETYAEFLERNPALFDRTLSALFEYYDQETLFSGRAREAFVEPDRAPLPRPLGRVGGPSGC